MIVQPVRRNLLGGGQDAQRNGQIEASGFLGQVGRSEVDGDAAGREFKPGVLQRCPNAITGFLDLGFGEPDDGKSGLIIALIFFRLELLFFTLRIKRGKNESVFELVR